jgi:hypothetical protein
MNFNETHVSCVEQKSKFVYKKMYSFQSFIQI